MAPAAGNGLEAAAERVRFGAVVGRVMLGVEERVEGAVAMGEANDDAVRVVLAPRAAEEKGKDGVKGARDLRSGLHEGC